MSRLTVTQVDSWAQYYFGNDGKAVGQTNQTLNGNLYQAVVMSESLVVEKSPYFDTMGEGRAWVEERLALRRLRGQHKTTV